MEVVEIAFIGESLPGLDTESQPRKGALQAGCGQGVLK